MKKQEMKLIKAEHGETINQTLLHNILNKAQKYIIMYHIICRRKLQAGGRIRKLTFLTVAY